MVVEFYQHDKAKKKKKDSQTFFFQKNRCMHEAFF